jgi:hypothetical protein
MREPGQPVGACYPEEGHTHTRPTLVKNRPNSKNFQIRLSKQEGKEEAKKPFHSTVPLREGLDRFQDKIETDGRGWSVSKRELRGVELARLQDMLQNILESYQDKAGDGLKGGKKKVRKEGGSKQRRSSKSPQFYFSSCYYFQMPVLSFLYVFPSSRVRVIEEGRAASKSQH